MGESSQKSGRGPPSPCLAAAFKSTTSEASWGSRGRGRQTNPGLEGVGPQGRGTAGLSLPGKANSQPCPRLLLG